MLRMGLARKTTALLAVIVAVLMVTSMLAFFGVAGNRSTSGAIPAAHTSVGTPAAPVTPAVAQAMMASPHPGTLEIYEVAPGGGFSLSTDPAVAYDTVDFEPNLNVYQQLIALNGSSTSSFLPELATCVPGTPQCSNLYGSTLITYNSTTNAPATYTFPIDSAARFYDPSTGSSWAVYPSDVMFSFARLMAWSWWFGAYPGWIQAQTLLPHNGNGSWFVNPTAGQGVYYYGSQGTNTSPQWIMTSMLVNDTNYCPSSAMSSTNGCITFVVGRDGSDGYGPNAGGAVDYPFFLQTLTASGAFVAPQGWFTAQGATMPYFPAASAASGDGPALLPGNAHSTSDAGYQTFLSNDATPSNYYNFASLANNWSGSGVAGPQASVQYTEVGSGPYALVSTINPDIGWVAEVNPAYHQPTGCAGETGCQPAPGSYAAHVHVYWDKDDSVGISQLEAGQADLAGIELPAHIATFDSLAGAGLDNYWNVPTISIFFQNLALSFNVSATNTLSGTAGSTNVPGDFLSNLAVREFLINAAPYKTINQTLIQLPGPTPTTYVSTGSLGGGAIPQGMTDVATHQSYYNYTTPWPTGNPIADPSVNGSAAWWWKQATTSGSDYYSSAAASCSSSSPCKFAMFGEVADTLLDAILQLEIQEIVAITGGAVQPYTTDLTFSQLGLCLKGPATPGVPGGGGSTAQPCPVSNLGWAPDYPDPTDYVGPFYLPDNVYTYQTAIYEQTHVPAFDSSSCHDYSANGPAGPYTMEALSYYSGLKTLPNECQGVAYDVSTYWFNQAANMASGTARVNAYRMSNAIEYLLGFYIWNIQSNEVYSFGPWVPQSAINSNIDIGGGGDLLYYNFPTSGVYPVTFSQTGLGANTGWTVDLNGVVAGSHGGSAAITEPNGVYSYTISPVTGYTLTNGTGTVTVSGGAVSQAVSYTPSVTPTPNNNKVSDTYMSPLAWGLFGTFLVLTLVFLATTVVYARRGRRPPAPPETWKQEGSPPGTPPPT